MFGVPRAAHDELVKNYKALEETNEILVKRNEELEKENKEVGKLRKKMEKEFEDQKALAFKTMELDFKEKHMKEINAIKDEYQKKLQEGVEENYTKLKDSLAKLHEEGNANTKYLEKMSISLMNTMGTATGKALGYSNDE
jgi:peptidoglycan hydrolase CwlO-like protein